MKILLLQDYLRSGGTERQSVLMARTFGAAGHDVRLITFRPGGALARTLGAVDHRSLQSFDTKLDFFAPGLMRAVREFDPDVVLCMGRMANCWAGYIAAALRYDEHGAVVVATMRTGKKLPWLFRRSLRVVHHIVANSDDAQDVLICEYKVAEQRVSVVRNALVFPPAVETGPGRISDRDVSVRREMGVGLQTTVLLWVGMFRPEKNQRGMLEIAAQLPPELDWQLWFAGEGSERRACERFAEKLGLGERVRFLGFRSDPTPLYAAADIAVLTSRSESLSNFLIEAHAHGLPSIAYGVTGVAECGGRVVPPEDQEAFVAGLLPLMKNVEARRAEGDRVAAYARAQFSPAVQANAYLDLFRRLLSREPM